MLRCDWLRKLFDKKFEYFACKPNILTYCKHFHIPPNVVFGNKSTYYVLANVPTTCEKNGLYCNDAEEFRVTQEYKRKWFGKYFVVIRFFADTEEFLLDIYRKQILSSGRYIA